MTNEIITLLRDEAAKVIIDRARGLEVSSKDVTGSIIWKAADEIERLGSALTAIISRSNNGDLGTGKVIDMRRIAEEAMGVVNLTGRKGEDG